MDSFEVFPPVLFLKANDVQLINTPFPIEKIKIQKGKGVVLGDTAYQAPVLIEEVEEVALELFTATQKASVPVFLLPEDTPLKEYKGRWEEISLAEVVVEANVWGKTAENTRNMGLKISAFADANHNYQAWEWEVYSADKNTIKCYPEIVYGWKPWRKASTVASLPMALQDLEKLEVSYEQLGRATGSYNLAFDCWVTHNETVHPENIAAEVMVWENWNDLQPYGKLTQTLDTPFGPYELWEGKQENWEYYAFRPKEQQQANLLNIQWFLSFLVQNNYLSGEQVLASIEFGNEVASGRGATIVKDYKIHIE